MANNSPRKWNGHWPHRRRLAAYAIWLVVGAGGSLLDRVHENLGVVAYPNKAWVGESLPLSPMYLGGAVGLFILYTLVIGHGDGAQGLFGGRPLKALELVAAKISWIGIYIFAGFLGAPSHTQSWLPFVGGVLLFVLALPDLWAERHTRLPLYAVLVVIIGVGAEWFATSHNAYVYPVCSSAVCLGSTVPLVWLAPLYLHAALLVHRLLGGRHFVLHRRAMASRSRPEANPAPVLASVRSGK